MPEVSAAALQAALAQRCQSAPDLTCEELLTGMLHNRLGRTLLRYAGFSLARPLGSLSAGELCLHRCGCTRHAPARHRKYGHGRRTGDRRRDRDRGI